MGKRLTASAVCRMVSYRQVLNVAVFVFIFGYFFYKVVSAVARLQEEQIATNVVDFITDDVLFPR